MDEGQASTNCYFTRNITTAKTSLYFSFSKLPVLLSTTLTHSSPSFLHLSVIIEKEELVKSSNQKRRYLPKSCLWWLKWKIQMFTNPTSVTKLTIDKKRAHVWYLFAPLMATVLHIFQTEGTEGLMFMSGTGTSNHGVIMVCDSHLFAFCIVAVHWSARRVHERMHFRYSHVLPWILQRFPGLFQRFMRPLATTSFNKTR